MPAISVFVTCPTGAGFGNARALRFEPFSQRPSPHHEWGTLRAASRTGREPHAFFPGTVDPRIAPCVGARSRRAARGPPRCRSKHAQPLHSASSIHAERTRNARRRKPCSRTFSATNRDGAIQSRTERLSCISRAHTASNAATDAARARFLAQADLEPASDDRRGSVRTAHRGRTSPIRTPRLKS
jgi:hypothetical protein